MAEVFRGRQSNGLIIDLAHLGQFLRYMPDQRRLVPFAAMRYRREKGCIGLNQNLVCGNFLSHISNGLRLGKGDVARKGDQKTHVHGPLGVSQLPGEAMQHAAQPGAAPVLVQQRQRIVPRIGAAGGGPAVDQEGKIALGGNLHLLRENALLRLARRVVIEIIQANLPHRDDLRFRRQPVERLQRGAVGEGSLMGMNSGAHHDPWHIGVGCIPAAQLQRAMHGGRPGPNANSQDRFDARIPCAQQHRFEVPVVAFAVQMCVGVNQHGRFSPLLGRLELGRPILE